MDIEFKFNAETAPTVFSNKPGDNILFLLMAQNTLNIRLQVERIISLNEILEYVGLSEIGKEGDTIVWRYENGDIIDFNLFDCINGDVFDQLNGDFEITIKLVV